MGPEIAVALAIAQGVTEFVGQKKAAKVQEQQNAEMRSNAIEARDNDLAAIEARRGEEKAAASQRLQEAQKQALQERSAAMASAGNSGLSVNALLSDYLRQNLNNEQTIQANLSNVNSQLDRERKSVITTAKSRVSSLPSVTSPSFLGSALKIGADAYAANAAFSPTPAKKPPTSSTAGANSTYSSSHGWIDWK